MLSPANEATAMISTQGVTLSYGQRVLFQDVSLKFLPGHCYGLIGANGAGKSTFLKILSGEIPADFGEVFITSGQRLAVLKQNQFEFDSCDVLRTVLMGNKALYKVIVEREKLYAQEDMTEEDGLRASDLETEFAELGGWDAEAQAAEMLGALGVDASVHGKTMGEVDAGLKVRVLLAQALYGNPDILLLDEPTNNLDLASIMWLEEFLADFKNTVIVVSHDRHFLDKVCTHIGDIDFSKITIYTGNYTFWYQASQLALKQRRDQNKKSEDRIKELKSFIERFSANASKSRQATSRKKLLGKLSLDDIKPSNRKYPHIFFQEEREAGKDLLQTLGLTLAAEGQTLIRHLDFSVTKGEKVAFVGSEAHLATAFFQAIAGEWPSLQGELRWGITTNRSYFPKDNSRYFDTDLNLINWLRQWAKTDAERDEEAIRGFLGKMLFSGEEATKNARVLSGGEKVRCMLAKIMMQRPNVMILDEPTNHLDLEAITSLNEGLIQYKGTLLFTSQDREFVNTIATRIVELTPYGYLDYSMTYDEFLESPKVIQHRNSLYAR